ncbi:SRPBCC domain-containing protein [Streptomyces phaeoluteigriseus]|uniref:SRPBCC domain-containing protein n=1 Tax=Streptomyces phaeoluteigriseus TaxID=114686 RepID=A0ABY4Z0D5_9ACTN|nr:SRPBCC domain-containing protein [Streptomyces phaeoluteigriseus]USQ82507.1 SRPBCC domain-containing protein [Streptomyces phaeoluteigriseus]
MEHEVFVPVPAERLRAALADPAQVARALPGFQQDAGTEPVAGRLKLRVGGHTITYRGTLRVTAREDGGYAVEGDATEARGSGTVELALTLGVRETDGASTLRFGGTATADGRIAELPADAVDAAAVRLLDRWAENLGAEAAADEPPAAATESETEIPPPGPDGLDSLNGSVDADDAVDAGDVDDIDEVDPVDPIAPSDPIDAVEAVEAVAGFPDPGVPPAEAAHARRTMIGRSAEEVDHAPPRGRYAPVPAPQTVARDNALRWAAPAAALAVASAIVVGRALRRRR